MMHRALFRDPPRDRIATDVRLAVSDDADSCSAGGAAAAAAASSPDCGSVGFDPNLFRAEIALLLALRVAHVARTTTPSVLSAVDDQVLQKAATAFVRCGVAGFPQQTKLSVLRNFAVSHVAVTGTSSLSLLVCKEGMVKLNGEPAARLLVGVFGAQCPLIASTERFLDPRPFLAALTAWLCAAPLSKQVLSLIRTTRLLPFQQRASAMPPQLDASSLILLLVPQQDDRSLVTVATTNASGADAAVAADCGGDEPARMKHKQLEAGGDCHAYSDSTASNLNRLSVIVAVVRLFLHVGASNGRGTVDLDQFRADLAHFLFAARSEGGMWSALPVTELLQTFARSEERQQRSHKAGAAPVEEEDSVRTLVGMFLRVESSVRLQLTPHGLLFARRLLRSESPSSSAAFLDLANVPAFVAALQQHAFASHGCSSLLEWSRMAFDRIVPTLHHRPFVAAAVMRQKGGAHDAPPTFAASGAAAAAGAAMSAAAAASMDDNRLHAASGTENEDTSTSLILQQDNKKASVSQIGGDEDNKSQAAAAAAAVGVAERAAAGDLAPPPPRS